MIRSNPDDPPNTLHSPRFSASKRLVNAIQILYDADIVSSSVPRIRIGWANGLLNEDDQEKCALTVPMETGHNTMVTVSFAASPCWTTNGDLHELALNIDQLDASATGSVRLLLIRLANDDAR